MSREKKEKFPIKKPKEDKNEYWKKRSLKKIQDAKEQIERLEKRLPELRSFHQGGLHYNELFERAHKRAKERDEEPPRLFPGFNQSFHSNHGELVSVIQEIGENTRLKLREEKKIELNKYF